ncbi:MAG: S8 family peptidase [Lachnospiraceae bacterium]|nr:S8 family peptidase [Lachnospiraceae bacterium]
MERVRRLVHAEEAFAAGYTGRGVTAAVIDTGIGAHPDIPAGRIRFFRDFVNRRGMPYDDSGHGTHVCGILAGSGRLANGRWRGIAPECSLVVLKALNRNGDGEPADVMAALKWVLERWEEFDIRIVNLSFGASCEEKDADYKRLLLLVEQVWEAGVCVVGAAGNLGPGKSTVTLPGCSSRIITVGASEAGKFANRYSGRGPGRGGSMKPDVVAPAGNIRSLMPLRYGMRGGNAYFTGRYGGAMGVLPNGQAWERMLSEERMRRRLLISGYAVKSGTSMSTPMVSGAACLLLQKEPRLSPEEIKGRLWDSAVDLGLPEEQQGKGMLDLRRLLF